MEKSTLAWIIVNYVFIVALFVLCIVLLIYKDARLSLPK